MSLHVAALWWTHPGPCCRSPPPPPLVPPTAAGVPGPCNPTSSNYLLFWGVLGPGSWLEVVTSAGHMQFCSMNPLLAKVFDALCHGGPISHEVGHGLPGAVGCGFGVLCISAAALLQHSSDACCKCTAGCAASHRRYRAAMNMTT